MSSLARVLAHVRRKAIQDEQNPLTRILLANPFNTLANSLFLLIRWKLNHALTGE